MINYNLEESLTPRPVSRETETSNEALLKNTILRIDHIRILYEKNPTSEEFLKAVISWLGENKHPDPESRASELFPECKIEK